MINLGDFRFSKYDMNCTAKQLPFPFSFCVCSNFASYLVHWAARKKKKIDIHVHIEFEINS